MTPGTCRSRKTGQVPSWQQEPLEGPGLHGAQMLQGLPPACLRPRIPDVLGTLCFAPLPIGRGMIKSCGPPLFRVRVCAQHCLLKRNPLQSSALFPGGCLSPIPLPCSPLFLIRITCELVAQLGGPPGCDKAQDSQSPGGAWLTCSSMWRDHSHKDPKSAAFVAHL